MTNLPAPAILARFADGDGAVFLFAGTRPLDQRFGLLLQGRRHFRHKSGEWRRVQVAPLRGQGLHRRPRPRGRGLFGHLDILVQVASDLLRLDGLHIRVLPALAAGKVEEDCEVSRLALTARPAFVCVVEVRGAGMVLARC